MPAISEGFTFDFSIVSLMVSKVAFSHTSGHCSAQEGLGFITSYSEKAKAIILPSGLYQLPSLYLVYLYLYLKDICYAYFISFIAHIFNIVL